MIATVKFKANATNLGTTTVKFMSVDPFHMAQALGPGAVDHLNWSQVVNLTVTITEGAKCCANITGLGNVSIDAEMQTPPYPKCKTDASNDHNFTVQAYPNDGWQFINWTGDISTAANPAWVNITGGTTKNVVANFEELPPQVWTDKDSMTFTAYIGVNPANQTLTIKNSGGGTLNWTGAAENYSPAGSWLGIDPINGSLGAGESKVATVTVNVSGLAEGPYTADLNISGSGKIVPVTLTILPATTIIPCRNITLPHAGGPYPAVGFVYAGETFNVSVSWTTCAAGNLTSVSLIDNTSVIENVTLVAYNWGDPNPPVPINETPAASSNQTRGTENTSVEYLWNYKISPNISMIVNYDVRVPAVTAPGWYYMDVDDTNDTWLEYYIDDDPTMYVEPIRCEYPIYVAAPAHLEGTVYEVVWQWARAGFGGNPPGSNLTLSGVNVTVLDTTSTFNLSTATGYYNMSLPPGEYILSASLAGFATETWGNVTVTGAENASIVRNFIGVNGLEPNAPFYTPNFALSYATKAVNAWLITPSVPAAALTLTEVGNVTAMWLNTP